MWPLYQWVVGREYILCVTITIMVLSLLISTPESSLKTFHLTPPRLVLDHLKLSETNSEPKLHLASDSSLWSNQFKFRNEFVQIGLIRFCSGLDNCFNKPDGS